MYNSILALFFTVFNSIFLYYSVIFNILQYYSVDRQRCIIQFQHCFLQYFTVFNSILQYYSAIFNILQYYSGVNPVKFSRGPWANYIKRPQMSTDSYYSNWRTSHFPAKIFCISFLWAGKYPWLLQIIRIIRKR